MSMKENIVAAGLKNVAKELLDQVHNGVDFDFKLSYDKIEISNINIGVRGDVGHLLTNIFKSFNLKCEPAAVDNTAVTVDFEIGDYHISNLKASVTVNYEHETTGNVSEHETRLQTRDYR